MNSCIISVGSNIDASNNIAKMIELLSQIVVIVKISKFETTLPIGKINQEDFTNGAILVETELDSATLKKLLKQIEDKLGRDRTADNYGPRTMDLDILVWNNKIVDNDYFERDFLRKSVAELGFDNLDK